MTAYRPDTVVCLKKKKEETEDDENEGQEKKKKSQLQKTYERDYQWELYQQWDQVLMLRDKIKRKIKKGCFRLEHYWTDFLPKQLGDWRERYKPGVSQLGTRGLDPDFPRLLRQMYCLQDGY